MGFMDKAKQLADQAQKKLDEVQTNVNAPGQQGQAQQQGGGQRFDANGRPIVDEEAGPPAGQAPPPSGELPEEPAGGPTPPPPAKEGINQTPDPFKPIE